VIAERALGRYLPDGVQVHHVDGDASNNANRNLVICQDQTFHNLLHVRTEVLRAGGDPNAERLCFRCGLKPIEDFPVVYASGARRGTCRACFRAYVRTLRGGVPQLTYSKPAPMVELVAFIKRVCA